MHPVVALHLSQHCATVATLLSPAIRPQLPPLPLAGMPSQTRSLLFQTIAAQGDVLVAFACLVVEVGATDALECKGFLGLNGGEVS